MTHKEIAERDIIEAYVLDRLTAEDRQAFEEHFFGCDLCFSHVQESNRYVHGLRKAAETGVLPPVLDDPAGGWLAGWLRPAFGASVAAALVLASVSGWLALVQMPKLRNETASQQRQLDETRQRISGLEQQLAQQSAVNRFPTIEANLPLVMLEASRAAGAANILTIPASATHAAVWIELGPEARAEPFRLEIRASSNQLVESIAGLRRNRYGALSAGVPAEHLTAGTYTARVFGANGALVSEYRLDIQR